MDTATKRSINLRMDDRTRALIDQAADALGKNRTEFMIETARAQAIDVILDQRLIQADEAAFDAFQAALDDPPAPGPKLRKLLATRPVWE